MQILALVAKYGGISNSEFAALAEDHKSVWVRLMRTPELCEKLGIRVDPSGRIDAVYPIAQVVRLGQVAQCAALSRRAGRQEHHATRAAAPHEVPRAAGCAPRHRCGILDALCRRGFGSGEAHQQMCLGIRPRLFSASSVEQAWRSHSISASESSQSVLSAGRATVAYDFEKPQPGLELLMRRVLDHGSVGPADAATLNIVLQGFRVEGRTPSRARALGVHVETPSLGRCVEAR